MAVKTYLEQLEETQEAIGKILSHSQSYSIAGRSLQRAELNALLQREKYLRKMVKIEADGENASVTRQQWANYYR